jgi:hypothetical protein
VPPEPDAKTGEEGESMEEGFMIWNWEPESAEL